MTKKITSFLANVLGWTMVSSFILGVIFIYILAFAIKLELGLMVVWFSVAIISAGGLLFIVIRESKNEKTS